MQPVDDVWMPLPTATQDTPAQGVMRRDLPAAPSSSSSRVSLHRSAKGKVDTCASSTRAMRTCRQLLALMLWATCARMLQLFVLDVAIPPFNPAGFGFLALAVLAGVLGWHRRR